MTPQEAEALEWSLILLKEAAQRLYRARNANDGLDTTKDLRDKRDAAHRNFTGKVRIYAAPADELHDVLLDLAKELDGSSNVRGHAARHYGAVLGAIQAMKEKP